MRDYKVNKGEIIFFSSGCYSDFGYEGRMVFIKDCDIAEVGEKFVIGQGDRWGLQSEFVTHLVAEQYCVPLESREIHLGDYDMCFPGETK